MLEDRATDYLVGMADPTDLYAVDEIQAKLSKPISQAIVRENDLLVAFDKVYRRTEEINALAEELGQELSDNSDELANMLQGEMTDAPVAKLLQSIFEDAVQMSASDVHIEPGKSEIRIRQRVDGILHEQVMKEIQIAPAVVVRLKLMADLNISEKRLPQDGRFHIKIKNHSIDVRLSTMPTQHGESVVMRLLDQNEGILNLDDIGMNEAVLERFRKSIHRPHGLVLLTGLLAILIVAQSKACLFMSSRFSKVRPGKKLVSTV